MRKIAFHLGKNSGHSIILPCPYASPFLPFQEMYSIKCGGCGEAILESYISSLDQHWHAKCFVCVECKLPFTEGNYFEHENK